jgi:hypothetical protein
LLTTRAKLATIGSLDKRTAAYKRTAELISALEADCGGDPTVAQRKLIERAALTNALIEDIEVRWLAGEVIDPALHATLANSLRRLLMTIGISRVAKPVSLRERLMAELVLDADDAVEEDVATVSDQDQAEPVNASPGEERHTTAVAERESDAA